MSLLNDNLKGYVESAPIEQAPKMRGNLLLIHSMMDDNVHPQNTIAAADGVDQRGAGCGLEDLSAGASRRRLQRSERASYSSGHRRAPRALPEGEQPSGAFAAR